MRSSHAASHCQINVNQQKHGSFMLSDWDPVIVYLALKGDIHVESMTKRA